MREATTSVAITREANSALDEISRKTGLTKVFLASAAIKVFFDPTTNPRLEAAVQAFESDRAKAEAAFMSNILNLTRGEDDAQEE